MKSYNYVDDVPGYGIVSIRSRNVSTSRNSPHLPQRGPKGSRRGRYLVLQQNPLYFITEDCQGHMIEVRRIVPPGRQDLNIKSTTVSYRSLFNLWFRDRSLTPSDWNAAYFKWWQKAQSVSANLADLYRTRQEAVDSITGVALRIANAAKACKNRQWTLMARSLGVTLKRDFKHTNPARVWLEYQYGLGPLCADVYTICNQPYPEPVRVVTASHSVNWDVVDNKAVSSSIRSPQGHRRFEAKLKCRGLVHAGGPVVAASSLGLTNPALYVWEALPFSFVIDWWQPIGPYIDLLGQMGTMTVTDASVTATIDCVDTYSGHTAQDSDAYANVSFSVTTKWHSKDDPSDWCCCINSDTCTLVF